METKEPPGRCFPARCGAAWGGYGAAWAAAVPRTGNTPFLTRLFFETRPLCFSRITASLPTISHHFPRFPGISRPPHPPPPIKCPRAVRLSWSAARTAAPCRAVPPGHCFPARCGAAMERLWRGMGGGRPPHRQHALSGFHETRDPRPGYCLARGAIQCEFRGFHETRITRHETRLLCFSRDTNHGFFLACFDRRVVRNAG